MEFLIGLCGPDYVLLASDTLSARSIMVLSSTLNKFQTLSPHQVLSSVGEPGETDRLKERLVAESSLAQLRMGRPWSTRETAHFTRSLMADALRSRSPYSVQLLLAGVDDGAPIPTASLSTLQSTKAIPTLKNPVPSLYWMDHFASLQLLPYAAHGYGAYFTWSVMDSKYRRDMTVPQAISLIGYALNELRSRFIIQLPNMAIKLVDASGVKEVIVDWSAYTVGKGNGLGVSNHLISSLPWKIIDANGNEKSKQEVTSAMEITAVSS